MRNDLGFSVVRGTLSTVAALCFFATSAMAATVASYNASADPAADPDANGNTFNAWTVGGTDGGSYFEGGSFGSNAGLWTIYDLNNAGGKTATHAFDGGALLPGQSVSLDYAHNTSIAINERVGIRLLDSSNGVQAEFSFLGGGGDFLVYDGTNNGAPSGKTYDPSDMFTVTFNMGAGSYSATATAGIVGSTSTGSWSGTYSAPITAIQVFTNGGEGSDQWFDNLNIVGVPEPSSLVLLSLSTLSLIRIARRRKA